ncbi:porin family protein [Bacteroidetes bacterium endosymbiont of Geopemphigus sp.]|uniref:porin family protein n=1 Tax=Bacteroidetes bacterium endosymbiont of Geopemphigus sp. TaxID=2047937 RepID=UPI000CD1731A|nr:porin family protein [Bacteroidetes bacterium endosymbiont of Geopemphigus sp.]
MKKLFLTIGLFSGVLSTQSQTIGQRLDKTIECTKKVFKQMEYGVKSGVNFSSVISLNNISSRTGFNAGVYGRYNIDQDMSIQPELLFSSQGFKNKSLKETVSNGYLNIPIMFQYRLVDSLAFEMGPQLGFAINKDNYHPGDSPKKANGFDFSLTLGVKYDVSQYFKVPDLGLTARYTIGLTNVYKADKISSNKNSVFQTGLAYVF